MKRLFFVLMICLISSISPAVVLLDDAYEDADRTDTALPDEAGFWASSVICAAARYLSRHSE